MNNQLKKKTFPNSSGGNVCCVTIDELSSNTDNVESAGGTSEGDSGASILRWQDKVIKYLIHVYKRVGDEEEYVTSYIRKENDDKLVPLTANLEELDCVTHLNIRNISFFVPGDEDENTSGKIFR